MSVKWSKDACENHTHPPGHSFEHQKEDDGGVFCKWCGHPRSKLQAVVYRIVHPQEEHV